jgi:hypothetical protein
VYKADLKEMWLEIGGIYFMLNTLGHGRHLDTHAVQVNEGGE